MFCPICKTAYREGFSTCADCNVELVNVLIDESFLEEQPEKEFIELLRTSSITDLVQIKSILDATDIEYFLQGENMMFTRPLDSVALMVADTDAEIAAELLGNTKLNFSRFNFRKK